MLFTFIDLFSGIGGTRLAFEKNGGKCIFSSEINKFACKTYKTNFNDSPQGDINLIKVEQIPDHDILVAGFPCQPFSLSGVVKRNSLDIPHGFKCKEQGHLFFKIVDILKIKQPKAFFLENVKHLKNHDKGRTFKKIMRLLNQAGYQVSYQIIDAKNLVPQHRERIYIVGIRKDLNKNYIFPEFPDRQPKLRNILEKRVDKKYTLSKKLWDYLQEYKKTQNEKGNGFGFGLVDVNKYSRTLSARYYKDGAEILIPQRNRNPRRLTPRECARLMGFPDSFIIPVSDAQAYRQFGNSVVVPVIEILAWAMVECLFEEEVSPLNCLFNDAIESNPKSSNGEETIMTISPGETATIQVVH